MYQEKIGLQRISKKVIQQQPNNLFNLKRRLKRQKDIENPIYIQKNSISLNNPMGDFYLEDKLKLFLNLDNKKKKLIITHSQKEQISNRNKQYLMDNQHENMQKRLDKIVNIYRQMEFLQNDQDFSKNIIYLPQIVNNNINSSINQYKKYQHINDKQDDQIKPFLFGIGKQSLNKLGLSGLGKLQIYNASKHLQQIQFEEVYSSDLKRCVETYEIIHKQLESRPDPKKITYTHVLRERDQGDLRLKTYDLVKLKMDEFSSRSYRPQDGESWDDVQERCAIFYNYLALKHLYQPNRLSLDDLTKFVKFNNFKDAPNKLKDFISIYTKPKKIQMQSQYGYFLDKQNEQSINILIISHGGFISETIIYLQSRENNQLFSQQKILDDQDIQMKENMYAKNASIFEIQIQLDDTKRGWTSSIKQRNHQKSSLYPFEGIGQED